MNTKSSSLTLNETFALEELIEQSITARYEGNLERYEDRDGGYVYTPLDNVRDLLTMLWGEHLTLQAIEDAAWHLVTDGAKEWPHAHCKEEDDEEALRRARDEDYWAECERRMHDET